MNGATHSSDEARPGVNGTTLDTQTRQAKYIKETLDHLFEPGQVVELRCPIRTGRTISGYFDDFQKLADAATKLSGTVPGVYVTLNRVNSSLLSRAANRVEDYAKVTTSDSIEEQQITRRINLLVDIDPRRPSGISSTDEEHQSAIARAVTIKDWLSKEFGFPDPMIGDSGNGAHLVYKIDIPNDIESKTLIEKCLKAIKLTFEDEHHIIDTGVANASRISKVYGTKVCKGDHTPERPHRFSKRISSPDKREIVPLELLNRLASILPLEPRLNGHRPGAYGGEQFDLEKWIPEKLAGVEIAGPYPWEGNGKKWIFPVCPWDAAHTNRSAFILQFPNGAIAAGCHHNVCAGKGWHELRDAVEPGWQSQKPQWQHTGNGARQKISRIEGHGEQRAESGEPADSATTESSSGACPYVVEGGRIARIRQTQNGPMIDPLCNFNAQIQEEIILDDGAEAQRAFVVSGNLDTGALLSPARINAARFGAMTWVTESWGMRAVVRAGNGTKDYLREAIQRLSPDAKVRQIFTHTGWRKINDQWRYLSGSTAGTAEYEVDLGPELARYKLPGVIEDEKDAMRQSLALLEIAPLTITAPLFATVYRAPLASALPQDLLIWLEGRTGSLKTTLAAQHQSHFGEFDRLHLPGAWASTANQLERRAFLLKDTVFVVDDYAPSPLDYRELESKASRLLRAQGNLAGRARLRSDLTERAAYYPRGIIISTGEQHPPGQSLLARTLVLELNRDDVDMGLLTKAQERADRLAHAMAGYIAWLAPQMDKMPALLRETFSGARTRASSGDGHLRIPEAVAHLWIGIQCAMTYAKEIGAIEPAKAAQLLKDCFAAFVQIAREQSLLVEEEQPTRRFLNVLHTTLSQGRALTVFKDERIPELKPGIDFIGWHDTEWFYLLPDAVFASVVRFCRDSGELFPIRQERLKRDLAKDKISECDPGRFTTTTRIGGHSRRVLQLHIEAIEKMLGVTGLTGNQHRTAPVGDNRGAHDES